MRHDLHELLNLVAKEITDTQNDIDAYLASDVPIECYRKDIDEKLNVMKKEIVKLICKFS